MGNLLLFHGRADARPSLPKGRVFRVEVSGEHLEHHGYGDGSILIVRRSAIYLPTDVVAAEHEGGVYLCCPCEEPPGPVIGKVIAVEKRGGP